MISYPEVCAIILREKNMTLDEIRTPSRKPELVYVRQLYMYFSVLKTKATQQQIGLYVNRIEHSTVISARNRINDLIDTEIQVRHEVAYLEKKINEAINENEPRIKLFLPVYTLTRSGSINILIPEKLKDQPLICVRSELMKKEIFQVHEIDGCKVIYFRQGDVI